MYGVIGYKGMVGRELMKSDNYHPMACDVNMPLSIRKALEKVNPDVVIYLAGKTNVDWCEENPGGAYDVNCWGIHNLLSFYRGKIIYISTDHIFDGKKFFDSGYSEKHNPSPLNVYGTTKLIGESLFNFSKNDFKIIRTSKLFDRDYLENKLKNSLEFSSLLKRSYLHVKHFCEGLDYVMNHWNTIPKIVNISGTDILSEYMFMVNVAKKLNIPEHYLMERRTKLKDAVPRPLRGGLNVNLAKKLGIPLYSAYEGIKLL